MHHRILVTATSVVGVMKMGHIAPRAGIELASLTFQASVLTTTDSHTPYTKLLLWCAELRRPAARHFRLTHLGARPLDELLMVAASTRASPGGRALHHSSHTVRAACANTAGR